MLRTLKIPVGDLQSNCFLAWDEATREAAVVDPGADPERIIEAVRKRDLKMRYILNTHGHGDHIGANGAIKDEYGVPILIHEAELPLLGDPVLNMSSVYGEPVVSPPADGLLAPGEKVKFGGVELEVILTNGHSPGGVSLYDGEGIVFTGDALFAGSIGRCDLPGGNLETLVKAIRKGLLVLPDPTQVLPGHAQNTTIGQERKWNPFLT
ncbi:MBL fold metallo-hydrolase [bacterium]|nr:MBL fold metallo-hydrolase [bacterium]